jgi:BNR repeat-containing family member
MRKKLIVAPLLGAFALSMSIAMATKPVDPVHNVAEGIAATICSDGKELHTTFLSGANGSSIFYSGSKDDGASWFPATKVRQADCSHQSAIVDKNGAIDVVWSEGDSNPDIYFSRSTDHAKTWSTPKDISNTPGDSREPSLAEGPDGTLHIVWSDTSTGEKNRDIYYSFSKDNGKTWGKDVLLPADNISKTKGYSSDGVIGVDKDGVVHVAWCDTSSGAEKPDIYYVQKKADTWSKATDISNTPGVSSDPSIATDAAGKTYIAWADTSEKENTPDIFFATIDSDGNASKASNISKTEGISSEPSLAASGNGEIAIVWSDTSSGMTNPDIFATSSKDGGAHFTKSTDVSNTDGISKYPQVAIAENKLHVVWEEMKGNKSTVRETSQPIK